jgi:para-nitrobenzyl esterase
MLLASERDRLGVRAAFISSPQPINAFTAGQADLVASAYLAELGSPTAAELVRRPAGDLVAAQTAVRSAFRHGRLLLAYQPSIDPQSLPVHPLVALSQLPRDIRLLVGTTRDELNASMAAATPAAPAAQDELVATRCADLFDDEVAAKAVADLYATAAFAGVFPVPPVPPILLQSDRVIRLSAVSVLETTAACAPHSFMLSWEGAHGHGATHMLGVPLVFGTTHSHPWRELTGDDARARRAARRYRAMVTALMRGEELSGAVDTEWPAYDLATRPTMLVGEEPQLANDVWGPQRAIWDRVGRV